MELPAGGAMLRRLPWLPFLMAGLAGCTATEAERPEAPYVVGSYSGTLDLTRSRSDGKVTRVSCPCTLRISVQTGTYFNGTATFEAPCAGTLAASAGYVQEDGAIEFSLATNLLGQGCVKLTRPPLSGTYSNGTIAVRATEEYDCSDADGFQYTLAIALLATRTQPGHSPTAASKRGAI